MDLKKVIMELLAEGKSDDQIAEKIKNHDELKGKGAKELIAIIDEAKRDLEIKKELLSRKEAEKEEAIRKDAASKVKEIVKEELKSINILDSKFSTKGRLLTFDHGQKKLIEDPIQRSEQYKQFNNMLKALGRGDDLSAKSISKEIDAENRKAANRSDSDSAGGYAVPTEVDNEIHELTYAQSVVAKLANTDNIIVDDKIYPTMTNVSLGYIADQDTAASQSTPTFAAPTVAMKRVGAFSAISNKLIRGSNANIVQAFVRSYASAKARFIDTKTIIGNITNGSEPLDGLVFDSNVNKQTAIALTALGIDDIKALVEAISDEANGNLAFMGNRKVANQLGLDETTGGALLFPQFLNGGQFAPLGIPFVTNTKITNVLDVGGDAATGGTDTAILLVDWSKFILGMGAETRIDTSDQFLFTKDQVVMRAIMEIGWAMLYGSGQAAQCLELTA